MKKILTAALLLASSAAFSQGLIGPKVGLNINSVMNSNTAGQTYTTSITPTAGIVLNAEIGEYFAIRPEILWVQRGAHTSDSLYTFFGFAGTETAKLTTNYLEIPLNLVGRYPVGPGKIEVFAGAAAGYNFGGKYKTPTRSHNIVGEDEPTHRTISDNNDYQNYLNVSLNFGVGYNWKGLIFQAGYNLGLSNMNAHPEDNENNYLNERRDKNALKSSSVTFGVAYLFGKKEEF